MKVIIIAGATATGKSALALTLAHELGGEIINADSMQLYRGMDIGTAKLNRIEREGIEHHMLDELDVWEDSNVAWYQEKVRTLLDQGDKNYIIVGGTGLYIKSILDDLNFPDTDPAVRERLNSQAQERGGAHLFERLQQLDPAAAIAIPRENVRRIIRALEVIEITGKPFTANLPRKGSTRYPHALQFALDIDRTELDERIEIRVEKMWSTGFVEEVRALDQIGIRRGRTAQQALGYAQILRFIDGEISEEQAKEETKLATRQYARRQETWFKRDDRIRWIQPTSHELDEILRAID